MDRIKVEMYRSFVSEDLSGGNLAGVVDHHGLDVSRMQEVANRVGVPETAFIEHVANSTKQGCYKMLFCTPAGDFVPQCGHGTIAAGQHLFMGSLSGVSELIQQYVRNGKTAETQVRQERGLVLYKHNVPRNITQFDPMEIVDVLGVKPEQIDWNFLPTGIDGDGLLGVTEEGFNDVADVNMKDLGRALQNQNLFAVHVFARDNSEHDTIARCRNFAPVVGIDEEPATGSATACLAHQFREQEYLEPEAFGKPLTFVQGEALGQPSDIVVEFRDGNIWVGGRVTHEETRKIS